MSSISQINSHNPQLIFSFEELPKEIVIEIFHFVKKWDLFKLMAVCKQWKALAQDSRFWKKQFSHFKLDEKKSTFPDLRKEFQKLDLAAKQGVSLWKTHVIFCEADLDFLFIKLSPNTPFNNEAKSHVEQKSYDSAFLSANELFKLNVYSLDRIRRFADEYTEICRNAKGWGVVAESLIEQNNLEAAFKIIQRMQNEPNIQMKLFTLMAEHLATRNKFHDALSFFTQFSSSLLDGLYEFYEDDATIKEEHTKLRNTILLNGIEKLLEVIKKTKNWEMLEIVIDTLLLEEEKKSHVLFLLKATSDENNMSAASALKNKYESVLE